MSQRSDDYFYIATISFGLLVPPLCLFLSTRLATSQPGGWPGEDLFYILLAVNVVIAYLFVSLRMVHGRAALWICLLSSFATAFLFLVALGNERAGCVNPGRSLLFLEGLFFLFVFFVLLGGCVGSRCVRTGSYTAAVVAIFLGAGELICLMLYRPPGDLPCPALVALTPGAHGSIVLKWTDATVPYLGPSATLEHRLNNFGWRGSRDIQPKKPGKRRIMLLGDSMTFGQGVKEDDLFSALLQKKLDERGGGDWEVINAARMGYQTVHEAWLLARCAPEIQPDLVIVCYYLNDALSHHYRLPLNVVNPDSVDQNPPAIGMSIGAIRLTNLSRSSYLIHFSMRKLEDYMKEKEWIRFIRTAYLPSNSDWIATQGYLRWMRDFCVACRAEFGILIIPMLRNFKNYPFKEAHAAIARFCTSESIPYMDLYPFLSGENEKDYWVDSRDFHLNVRGHRVAAKALYDFVCSFVSKRKGPSENCR